MQPSLEVRDVTKAYRGTVAVDRLSFQVRPGEVTGFVGPNGAGKSTTMRLLLGLDAPDGGDALVNGERYARLDRPLTHVGALLDADAVHPSRRARDHLLWLARSNRLPDARVGEVLDQVGLASVGRKRVGGFSLGMRQRLGIAAALLGDPPVVMFDEPTNGLDPDGIVWIRELVRTLASQGRVVLVSSHLMRELQDTADRLVVIGRGRLVADTTVDDLLGTVSRDQVEVVTPHRSEATTVLANAGARVTIAGGDGVVVEGLPGDRVAALLGTAGIAFTELRRYRASLEEAYMALTRDAVEFAAAEEDGR
ncbi:ATP-binding cassette domain-containing protein [Cellulomonas alba]|uniref:ATP-binding cassette domain-containing protein n=1 Tax=Cellulomonas alba TaxID=3053467 RepID=A0ABT7SDA3_9CELL|nr:ATP-binding cassette domain-containing protein [Cellulomonas alba]MDM7854163.1 ATP-binding cassette domain-containing protein [Cellulomonas alba]